MDEKYLYKIGEVSRIVGVEPHVIRYWEKEFSFLKPSLRGKGGQRLYTQEDVEKISKIKRMLYEEGLKIEGVRKFFQQNGGVEKKVIQIKKELREIRKILEEI